MATSDKVKRILRWIWVFLSAMLAVFIGVKIAKAAKRVRIGTVTKPQEWQPISKDSIAVSTCGGWVGVKLPKGVSAVDVRAAAILPSGEAKVEVRHER